MNREIPTKTELATRKNVVLDCITNYKSPTHGAGDISTSIPTKGFDHRWIIVAFSHVLGADRWLGPPKTDYKKIAF